MASGFVFMDMALVGRTIDNRYSLAVCGFCKAFIATFYSFDHVFDVGAQMGALAGIVLAMFFRLTCTLARLR